MTASQAQLRGHHGPYGTAVPEPTKHAGQIPVDLQSLLDALQKLLPGRAGGDDGVAAEFVTALGVGAKVQLAEQIRAVWEWRAPAPAGWTTANLALVPKLLCCGARRLSAGHGLAGLVEDLHEVLDAIGLTTPCVATLPEPW